MEASLGDWLSDLSVLGICTASFVAMLVSALAGHYVRQVRIDRSKVAEIPDDPSEGQEEYLLGGSLALLALLLAFTFGLVLNRYEARRQLVTDEANAIGTAYLRAQLLDEPHRSRLSGLLIAYTENRIQVAKSGAESPDHLARNDQLLTRIWASVSAARESALAHGISMPVLDAFNEVINLDTERKAAWRLRVPGGVLILLLAYLIVTAGELGYIVDGVRGRRAALMLFVLIALSIGIMTDMDRPSSGVIRESQWPMVELLRTLRAQPPPIFDQFKASPPVARNPKDHP
jgi:hypothetical protein